ncbi:peptidoglycan-binding protein [Myxococcus sp. CA056]|uniref:peptidoglycan-binding protein n=1 Tax=Myxococcus sp. CA056 TaxID=2741740 RepID=UPI00157AAC26|nr:peptidoglycan-binding protein [Myxococcus sp. CA056]NTX11015.1 peptidoglycan-binding protein [Myxococcus sp. CA056]
MRVDGSSRPTQTISSEGATETARNETSSQNHVVEQEDTSGTEGFDSTSRFEDGDGGAVHRERLQPPPPPPPPEEEEETPVPLPLKDLKRGDSGPEVKALQDALVTLGYLTEEQVATGPGQFGPKTAAALERFQAEHDVTATGQYAAGTREALTQALTTQGGARRPAMSAEAAFITQFTSEYNPTGPRGSTNCGPASLAMSLAYTGHMPPGLSKEQQVDYARALMSPRRESEFTHVKASDGTRVPQLDRDRELTGGTMVGDGIKAAGLGSRYGQGWEALDQQLAAGNPVIANGQTNAKWRDQFPERMGSGDIGHLNAILGKTPDGKYLVADPLHTGGPVAMTREQLGVFFSPTRGQPSFTALEGASRATSPAANAGSSAGTSVGDSIAGRLDEAAQGLPVPEPELTTPKSGVGIVSVSAGTDVKTRAAQDAKALESTLKNSLEQGARQFEQFIASNPDPVYQEAFVRAAEPSLAKMGQLFAGVSPETNRQLHPRPPLRQPDLDNPEVLKKLADQENRIEHQTFYSLTRATELLKDPAAGMVGKAFTRDAPPGLVNMSMTSAVRTAVNFGLGTRLAFDIERSLNRREVIAPGSTAPTYGKDQAALHRTLWSAIDGVRGDFAMAAEKAELHQKKLTALLGGPSAILTPQQQKDFISAYVGQAGIQKDLAEFERLGKLLATAAPDGVPQGSDDPRVAALARELPRMAETQGGASYLAGQLAAKAEDAPLFLDVVGKLKDGKDFDEKLALALVKSAGTGALLAAGGKSPGTAQKIFDGLARCSDVFGMKPDDMKAYVRLLRTIKPGTSEADVRKTTQSLNALLTEQETGLPYSANSPRGQALRGLGLLVVGTAFAGDASNWSQADLAAKLKIVGDGLSFTADGGVFLAGVLGKTATAASTVAALGKASAIGAVLGAAGDALQSFQYLREGDGWKASASGAQALGGALMAGAALFSWAPGFQVLGAALFLGGLGAKYLDPEKERTREEQVKLLTASGMDATLARNLITLGPELLDQRLCQDLAMSPEQVQKLIADHPSLGQSATHLDSLVQAADAMKIDGARFQEFLERLAKAHGVDVGTLAREVHTRFFGHPPSSGAGGGEVYLSQAHEFRAWVESRTPEVATWAKQNETR